MEDIPLSWYPLPPHPPQHWYVRLPIPFPPILISKILSGSMKYNFDLFLRDMFVTSCYEDDHVSTIDFLNVLVIYFRYVCIQISCYNNGPYESPTVFIAQLSSILSTISIDQFTIQFSEVSHIDHTMFSIYWTWLYQIIIWTQLIDLDSTILSVDSLNLIQQFL